MSRVIALGGAGAMGRRAVERLSETNDVDIVVADRDATAAERVAERCGGRPAQVDVRDGDELAALFAGADLVMNTVGPFTHFAEGVIKAALDAEVDYIDICDDYEPTRTIFDTYSEAAQEGGLRFLIGMGASPGVSNLLARYAYERLDTCAELHTAWTAGGGGEGADGGASAALEHMLLGAAGTIPVWEDGRWQDVPAFREEVSIRFPVTGECSVRPIGHPEPLTLPRRFTDIERSWNYGALAPSGLNELVRLWADRIESGEVSGVAAARRFVAQAAAEPERWLKHEGGQGGLCAIARGELDGQPVELSVTCAGFPGGGMAGITGHPLAVGAEMLLNGELDSPGVLAPEELDPARFLQRLSGTWELHLGQGLFIEELRALG